jgi:hypothetical protein
MGEPLAAGTPPSPFSPWAPWATDKRSFADALRSPPPPLSIGQRDDDVAAADDIDAPAPTAPVPNLPAPDMPAPAVPAAAASHASAGTSFEAAPLFSGSAAGASTGNAGNDAPLTFGAAFAAGVLRNTDTAGAASFFGKGLAAPRAPSVATSPRQGAQDLTATQVLEPDGNSISMRAAPSEAPCIPNVDAE